MQILYHNGTVIPMTGEHERADALVTENGRIAAVGTPEELRRRYPRAEAFDLERGALLPAFIDAHSHFSGVAGAFLQVSLAGCAGFDEIRERIARYIEENAVPEGTWVLARDYEPSVLREKTHPALAVLDTFAPCRPLVLQHQSGHTGLFNSLALRLLGVTSVTPSPEGGKIGLTDGRLNGYMEENAFLYYLQKVPQPGEAALLDAYRRAAREYASFGVATVQEGMMVEGLLPLYRRLTETGALPLDVVGYAGAESYDAFREAFPKNVGRYDRGFKLGGVKLFLDGSPQAKTAWLREPYLGEASYCGYGTMTDEALLSALRFAAGRNAQVLVHCNGDRAADQFLDAVGILKREGTDLKRLRPVMIHAQLLDPARMKDLKKLGVIPSFFVSHVLHFGDIHIENLGESRAQRLSPCGSAAREGLVFTLHRDSPVLSPNVLESVSTAVLRRTARGVPLGENERVSVYEALRANMQNAAYAYFEEREKGTLEVGKRADLVILSANPLDLPPERLAELRVRRTVKDGRFLL